MVSTRYAGIYAYQFLGEFTPIVPYMTIYFSDQDIALPEISLILLALSLTVVVAEIPTGMLADKMNNRVVLALSRTLKALAFVTWFLFPVFIGFLSGAVLWGLATALSSGAFQSFLYDYHGGDEHQATYTKVYGASVSSSLIGFLFSAGFASLLVHLGFNVMILVSVISVLASVALLAFLRPAAVSAIAENDRDPAFTSLFKSSISHIVRSKGLLTLVIIGVAAGGIKGSLDEFHAIFFDFKGIELALIGVFIASIELVKPLGTMLSGWLHSLENNQVVLLIAVGLCIAGAGALPGYYVMICMLSLAAIDALLMVFNDSSIQKRSSASNRATVLSLKNFGIEATALLIFAFVSLTTHYVSLSAIYVVCGAATVFIGIVAALPYRTTSLAPSDA